jgi:hypothetical protein
MPLHWIVESRPKLVTIVAEGEVCKADVDAYLAMIDGANLSEWRKLMDARKARPILNLQDVNELGVRIRAAAVTRQVGPLAFVVPAIDTPELLRLLGFLAAAKRPMRVFRTIGPARKWIAQVPF